MRAHALQNARNQVIWEGIHRRMKRQSVFVVESVNELMKFFARVTGRLRCTRRWAGRLPSSPSMSC